MEGKVGVVPAPSGQGVDMTCGRRVNRRIRHHPPGYPVVTAAAVVVVVISLTWEGEEQPVDRLDPVVRVKSRG